MRAPWEGAVQILDSKVTTATTKAELRERVVTLRVHRIVPGLGTIPVGDDSGPQTYVADKHRGCAETGIESICVDLPGDVPEAEVPAAVERLNQDPVCTGYIVQLSLPADTDTDRVLEAIGPEKDVDGLHPMNLGRLVLRMSESITSLLPCTPWAVIELGRCFEVSFAGKDVHVVGRDTIVGCPIGLLPERKDVNATVTSCHMGAHSLAEKCHTADVIVAASGVAGLITSDMVCPSAVVFDVGVPRAICPDMGKSRLAGDVAAGVDQAVEWLSPNSGGVGPMTRALLLVNVVEAAEWQLPDP